MNEQLAIVNRTPHKSLRLFLSKAIVCRDSKEFGSVSALSVWGECDKECTTHFSWEFDPDLEKRVLEFAREINKQKRIGGFPRDRADRYPGYYDHTFFDGLHKITPIGIGRNSTK